MFYRRKKKPVGFSLRSAIVSEIGVQKRKPVARSTKIPSVVPQSNFFFFFSRRSHYIITVETRIIRTPRVWRTITKYIRRYESSVSLGLPMRNDSDPTDERTYSPFYARELLFWIIIIFWNLSAIGLADVIIFVFFFGRGDNNNDNNCALRYESYGFLFFPYGRINSIKCVPYTL